MCSFKIKILYFTGKTHLAINIFLFLQVNLYEFYPSWVWYCAEYHVFDLWSDIDMGSHILQSNDFIGFQHYSLPYILHQIGKLENELQHFNQTLACRPKSNCFFHHNISLPMCCVCNIFANCKSETLKGMWTIQWYYASVWCGWWPNYTICAQAWCGRLHISCTNVSLVCLFDLRFGLFGHIA